MRAQRCCCSSRCRALRAPASVIRIALDRPVLPARPVLPGRRGFREFPDFPALSDRKGFKVCPDCKGCRGRPEFLASKGFLGFPGRLGLPDRKGRKDRPEFLASSPTALRNRPRWLRR